MNHQMMRYTGEVPGGSQHRCPVPTGQRRLTFLKAVWTSSCLREEASEKSQPRGVWTAFQVGEPASIQEPTQSCLIRTKDTPMSQEIPRVLGALCPGWVKDQLSKQKMVLVL